MAIALVIGRMFLAVLYFVVTRAAEAMILPSIFCIRTGTTVGPTAAFAIHWIRRYLCTVFRRWLCAAFDIGKLLIISMDTDLNSGTADLI